MSDMERSSEITALRDAMLATFHQAIATPYPSHQEAIDAILTMPEMQALKSCVAALASLHYNDGYLATKPEQVERLRAGLAAGGGLPPHVIEWVLA